MIDNLEWEAPVTQPEEATLDPFSKDVAPVSLPEDVSKKRAVKAAIAFSGEEKPPSYDELLKDIQSGREDRLRDRLATSESLKKQQVKQQLIREVVDSGTADDNTLLFLQGLSADEVIEPKDILEKKYAEWRINMGITSDETGTVDKAIEADPEGMNQTIDASVDRVYRKEYAQSALERSKARYDQTGMLRTATDFVSDMLPFFTWLEDRNLAPDNVQAEGVTPGNFRQSFIRDLHAMPAKEFRETIDEMENASIRSGDHLPFLQLMEDFKEYSDYAASVDTAFGLLSAAELVPGVGLTGDAIVGAGKAGMRVGARRAVRKAVGEGVSKEGSGAVENAAVDAVSAKQESLDTLAKTIEGADGKTYTIDGKVVGQEDETVKNAAVRFGDRIFEGPNHGVALDNAAQALGKTQDELIDQIDQNTEGFLTSTGRFVSREEADTIARAKGQKKQGSDNQNFLGSEDLVPASPKLGSGTDHVEIELPKSDGSTARVQVPATEENLARIHAGNVEAAATAADDDLANILASAGDADQAAFQEALSRFRSPEAEAGKATIEDASKDLARKLPSLLDPTGAVTGRAAHSGLYKLVLKKAAQYASVLERQAAVNKKLMEALVKSQTIGAIRLSDDVFQAIQPAMRAQMDKLLKTPSSAIQDLKIEYLREWQTGPGRTNQIVYKMGKPDGTFFDSVKKAKLYAQDIYGIPEGYFSIEARSPGAFGIRVAKNIDETDPSILNYAIQTDTKTPVSWAGAFISYFRSSAGVSSELLQKNLKISAHHANMLHEAFQVAANDVGKLSRKEMKNLDALMAEKRDIEHIVVDPLTGEAKKVRGEWFTDAADLEQAYKRNFGEFPSDNVVSAYFTMRQMYDFDLAIRNFSLYRQKTRLGIVTARPHIPIPDPKDPTLTKWVKMKKGVEVKPVDTLPEGNHDVLILNSENGSATYVNTARSGLKGIQDLQGKGYRILQVANPDQRPFKSINNNYVQFVVTKDVEVVPLSPNQLPATEGGHVRYNEGFFVKQPRFEVTDNGEKLYLGDRTIIGASTEAEIGKHAAAIETGRQLLKDGKIAELKTHLDSNLPWSVGEFQALFKPQLGPKGEVVEEAALSLDTPIGWVADGQGINDAAKTHLPQLRSSFDGVRDTIDDPNNLYRTLGKKYTGEKDFALSKAVYDEEKALWDFQKARMISPMETLEQAWAETARTMATDDLKIQSITNWIEEAASALETPLEQLRQDPFSHFLNPRWNAQYGDVARRRVLDIQREQIMNFLGQRDSLGTTLDWMRNKLLNSVYNNKGQKAADWVDDHVLPNVKNPLAFARAFAFHTKMGFFNPIQLFLQMNTMVNTFAITGNPLRVGSALSGVMLMQMARVNRNPEILAALGKKAEKLGWRPGEWEEMESTFRNLALHVVEGEVGSLDVMTSPKLFKGVGGQFLDKGLFFFRESERVVRMNAWAVAFKEFRDKNPTKVLNNMDVNTILARQEVLSGNMTRSSNALWQKGLTGPMTQFWGYPARITEQLLGKQLTRAEKLRLGTAFAAMYGVPVSLSAATMFQVPGWSTDDIRKYALENGIDVNSGLASVAMNGLPAELIRWMTSDENGQNGYLPNIGDRYGPGGLPVFKQLLEAKDGVADAIIDLALGASGSITRDFFKQVLPDNWDILESASNVPNMTLSDFSGMFSTISTVNNATKLVWALNTHKAMMKDGLSLGDKDSISAWISFTTGLDEQRFKDTMLKIGSMKDLKEATDQLGKEYVKLIRQAKLLQLGSKEREAKIRKARALLIGLPPQDVKRFVKQAYKDSGDLDESVDKNFQKKVLNK